MSRPTEAESVVQRQLEAYNSRDLEAWLQTYHHDAAQFELGGACLALGHSAMRQRMASRFEDPTLNARLISRVVMSDTVVDHEIVTRTESGQQVRVEMLCIYQVECGRIRTAHFKFAALTR